MKNYLKFVGNRKTLKSLGFTFGKYFANNYIGYHLNSPNSKYIQMAMVWIAGIKDCSLRDFNMFVSAILFQIIKSGEIQKYKYESKLTGTIFRFVVDNDTMEALAYDPFKHDMT